MPNRDKSNGTNNSNPIAPSTIVEQEVRYKRLSHRAKMLSNPKDFAKKFAKSDSLCIFVVPNVLNKVHKTYSNCVIAGFLEAVPFFGSVRLATKRGSASFCTYIN